jgi:16S rRNA G1207 methylase RsmC
MGAATGPPLRPPPPVGSGGLRWARCRPPSREIAPLSSRSTAFVDGLNPTDPGVRMLADAVAGAPSREILLVACGDIPGVGAPATRLVLDVRELDQPGATPLRLAPAGPSGFAHAIVWPRAHLGKDFTFACLARGALGLRESGTLWCAVRKAKGADSVADFMAALLGDVQVHARARGYRLLRARRAAAFDPAPALAALDVAYTITDPVLEDLRLHAVPGVFSRRHLDEGTRCLIEHAAASGGEPPQRVLDLGAGVGPLALWAARRWPHARVLAVEANLLAAACCERNAQGNGLADRVCVERSAGLPPAKGSAASFAGATDLALVNPPTHADPEALARFVADALSWLQPRGRAMFVVSRASALVEPLRRLGASAQAHDYPHYTVVMAARAC